jgi:hypothetical protein
MEDAEEERVLPAFERKGRDLNECLLGAEAEFATQNAVAVMYLPLLLAAMARASSAIFDI